MTTIEWVRGADGSKGLCWNAFRAERIITRKGQEVKVSANHCEHVNNACRICYAGKMNLRHGGLPFKPGHRKDYTFVVDEEKLVAPLHRKKPTNIFVESMSDLFGAWWPTSFIDRSYAAMALSPQHTYINLSKRPERRREYLDRDPQPVWEQAAKLYAKTGIKCPPLPRPWPLPNVIEGTSVSCQKEADEFLPILMLTNAAWRAVSCEPLLGPIDLRRIVAGERNGVDALTGFRWAESEKRAHVEDLRDLLLTIPKYDLPDLAGRGLDWVIVGGESGQGALPMHPKWARDICQQCQGVGVAFFLKQWGIWAPDEVANVEMRRGGAQPDVAWPDGTIAWGTAEEHGGLGLSLRKLKSKKDAGRLLDGREWNGFPDMAKEAQAA